MPEIGDEVEVTYLDFTKGGPTTASGRLGVVVDDADRVTQLVVEGDGSAMFIDRDAVISVRGTRTLAEYRAAMAADPSASFYTTEKGAF